MHFLLLIAGMVGLWMGSMIMVSHGKAIAARFGISELLVGLTIVSIGVSLPEIMVSIFSGAKGASGVAVGSMVGSCLTQITLILGIAGFIHNIKASAKAIKIDGTALLLVIIVFWVFGFTGREFTRIEGIASILFYTTYLIFTSRHDVMSEARREDLKHFTHKDRHIYMHVFLLLIGLAVLFVGADIVLENALFLTKTFGFSQTFIGVMIVGVATCLPELSTAVASVVKRAPGISVGSLIGSNITDPLFSIGIGATVFGFKVEDMNLFYFDIPFWFLSTVLALYLIHRKYLTLNRYEASVLIATFAVFAGIKVWLFA